MRRGGKSLILWSAIICLMAAPALGAQVLNSKDRSLLEAIAKKETEKALRLLRARGANPKLADANGRTVLMNAVASGLPEVVKELLARGADINAKSKEGQTALMVAADFGHVDMVRLLLSEGADCKMKDKDEWTALQYAAMRVDAAAEEKKKSYEEILKILKEAEKSGTTQASTK